ncbi:MAG: LysE family translocator [Spirochaetia bacterium]|nr:MAG: LysE family translocator [Spirochaetia bacterium]
MTTAMLISMASFSLAASISPGPVNIVAMSAGMRHGFVRSMWFVTGATIAFVVLLVIVGLGLSAAVSWLPNLLAVVRWAGVLFLIYMAVGLATDGGAMSPGRTATAPSAMDGALLQWLNPKAWLASIAGMGVFSAGADVDRLLSLRGITLKTMHVRPGESISFKPDLLDHHDQTSSKVRLTQLWTPIDVLMRQQLSEDFLTPRP